MDTLQAPEEYLLLHRKQPGHEISVSGFWYNGAAKLAGVPFQEDVVR